MNKPILSICISTYNKGQIILDKVNEWLKNSDENLEIVVADNGSANNTVELLKTIEDKRFILLERNEGDLPNSDKVLLAGNGKYVMSYTDKDLIRSEYINKAIEILKDIDVSVGKFVLDYDGKKFEIVKYTSIVDKIIKFAFRANHPSGFFYRKDFLSKEIFEKYRKYDNKTHAFFTDFITTLLCNYGDCAEIYLPFAKAVYPPFEDVKHSYTYSQEKGNLFFTPEYKFDIFEIYLKYLHEIVISSKERRKIIKKIIRKLYTDCTEDYLSVLNKKVICDWYNMDEKFIINEKQRNLNLFFFKKMIKSKAFDNIIEHFYAIITFVPFWIKKNIKEA